MSDRFLDGRTALVTGATSGIGLAIACALAEAGARVAISGLGDAAQVAGCARRCRCRRRAGDAPFRRRLARQRRHRNHDGRMRRVGRAGNPGQLRRHPAHVADRRHAGRRLGCDPGDKPQRRLPHHAPCAAGDGRRRLWAGDQHRLGAWPDRLDQQGALHRQQVRPDRTEQGRGHRVRQRRVAGQRRRHRQLHLSGLGRDAPDRTADHPRAHWPWAATATTPCAPCSARSSPACGCRCPGKSPNWRSGSAALPRTTSPAARYRSTAAGRPSEWNATEADAQGCA